MKSSNIFGVVFVCIAIALIIFTLFLIISPFIYLEGKAKSELLSHQGISMPWYKAAFVPDMVFVPIPASIDINYKNKNTGE